MAADNPPDFDDPSYVPVDPEKLTTSDGSYDSPTAFLDRVPQRSPAKEPATPLDPEKVDRQTESPPEERSEHGDTAEDDPTSIADDSGAYSTIDDLVPPEGPGCSAEEGDEEEDGEGEGMTKGRFVQVRQSRLAKLEESKIYIKGSTVELQPLASFKKSRIRSRSKEQLEEEGIYQCLNITDEQRQQMGIMPEAIYTTLALQKSGDELENMSMEIGQNISRPVSQTRTMTVTPYYRGFILYPPPLPPLSQEASTAQRKRHAILENILKSEAAFLTSLKIAEQVYMKPLLDMSSPPIEKEQVKTLFGPIQEVMVHHELFYTALTLRTMDWGPKQTVGNVFMTFYRREVIGHYVRYVNNFTEAMETLQKGIKKRPKFVNFLKQKYQESKTSLSLQGLLLKPIQRFPQYILFLQDLIKYTPPHHPDRVTLQLALAHCETIAEHLNEAKRRKEQQSIMTHLSPRVTHLPFKLADSPDRCLLMQETVTRLTLSPQGSDNLVEHKRSLLLFNNMVLCAAISQKRSSKVAPRDAGPFDDTHYKCKWFSPLDQMTVVEPDYTNDIWDYVMKEGEAEEADSYDELKSQFLQQTEDFMTMGRIASLVSALTDTYTGLSVVSVQSHLRILQRKIAKTKEQLRGKQPGRLDIQIPSWDGSQKIHHTYVFESEKAKQNWLNNMRYATLKLNEENKLAWVCAENAEEDEVIVDSTGHLPLLVDHYNLTNSSESLTTECATRTHDNQVWFASCSRSTAEIAIIKSVTPKPILLKSFTVDSSRILAICYAPHEASSSQSSPPQSSMSALISSPSLSPSSDTIWMGSQDGKLMIHPTSSEMAHRCMEVIKFTGPITCIEYYKNQMFIAVEGNIYIYKRPKDQEWDLDNPVAMRVHSGEEPITCMCLVQQKLWIGAGRLCYVLNMVSCTIEGHFQVSREPMAIVRNMASSGSGVWISLRRSATVQLFHTITKTMLQEVDIEKAFLRITTRYNIQSKLHGVSNLHVTSLLLCNGYLWIGTSVGTIMVYRTPYLKTVPITTGKPYLALHSHASGVRVLISTHTVGTLSSSRLDQFISEEQERFQEDWETSETTEDSQVPLPIPSGSDIISVNGGGGDDASGTNSTLTTASDTSTFPPLPPPVFPDETSLAGTLQSVAEPQQEPASSSTDDKNDSMLNEANESLPTEAQALENGHDNPSEATVSTSTATTEDAMSLPVRQKSYKLKPRSEGEGGVDTFRRVPTPDRQDMETFRHTLEPQRNGNTVQSCDREDDDDQGTLRRKDTPPPLYDDVATDESPRTNWRKSPSPYEDPTTLDLTGPIPIRPMPDFFSTLTQSSVITPYGNQTSEGAVHVLSGGRGLVNLQPGKRRSVHYIALSGSGDISTADESCIMAFELKH